MQTTCKAINNFSKPGASAQFVITFVGALLESLRNNAHFPGMNDMLDALERACNGFTEKWSIAQTGSAAQKADAKTFKLTTQQLIKPIWERVNYVANGSREKLLTTSFELTKPVRTNIVLQPIEEFSVRRGINEGELIASFKKQTGMKAIVFEYTYDEVIDANTRWIAVSSSKVSCVLAGLTPGATVHVRVSISAARKQTVYSNPIKSVVGFAQ